MSPFEEIKQRYALACSAPSDINEHVATLHRYAEQCERVVEMGVRNVVSTWGLLAARPKKLVCYDLIRHVEVDDLERLARQVTDFSFIQGDVLSLDIEETDLLFIDTWHTYDQLKAEFARHGNKATKYIVLHDTEVYGIQGNDGKVGLLPAVDEIVVGGVWKRVEVFTNNNGLTVLGK